MKRVLSQPAFWIRSPTSPRRRSETEQGAARPAVHWEDSSEDESPRGQKQLARSVSMLGIRRLSMSPGVRAELDAHDIDIGTSSSHDSNSPVIASRTVHESLERKNLRFSAIYAGRGGITCAKFLYEHFLSYLVEELQQSDALNVALPRTFQRCDDDYNMSYARDASGSDALVAIIQKKVITIAWAGRARAVLCCGGDVRQLTADHCPSNASERRRVLDAGGLITSGQIMGVMPTTRGFGDNDIKNHMADGVFLSEPSMVTFTIDEATASTKMCFLLLASNGVFEAFSNEAACRIVTKALVRHDHNATVAAAKLARAASKRVQKSCGAAVVLWCDTTQRSRSSSATSWRSLRSFSTLEVDES